MSPPNVASCPDRVEWSSGGLNVTVHFTALYMQVLQVCFKRVRTRVCAHARMCNVGACMSAYVSACLSLCVFVSVQGTASQLLVLLCVCCSELTYLGPARNAAVSRYCRLLHTTSPRGQQALHAEQLVRPPALLHLSSVARSGLKRMLDWHGGRGGLRKL